MKLSAVVQLLDSYQNQPAYTDDIEFLLNGDHVDPLRKAGSQFVLSNLEAGTYQMAVNTEYFFPEEFDFHVETEKSLSELIYIRQLRPNPLYPYAQDTTLLRGIVKNDKDMTALPGVTVKLQYVGFRGRARSAQTQTYNRGAYDGRYALAVTGKHQTKFDLNVEFSKPGFLTVNHQVSIENGNTHFLDTNMKPSRE